MSKRRSGTVMMACGLVLILSAAALTGYNLWEEREASASVMQVLEQLQTLDTPSAKPPAEQRPLKEEEVVPDYLLDPTMEMPVREISGWEYIGTLEIPALEKSLPIISRWSYPALKVSPSRYSGSAYTDDLIIAGHNYQSHFSGLSQLKHGDALSFTDMDGNKFLYEVVLVETLRPTDLDVLTGEDWDLTMFTCTPGGRARVTVRCERQDTTVFS